MHTSRNKAKKGTKNSNKETCYGGKKGTKKRRKKRKVTYTTLLAGPLTTCRNETKQNKRWKETVFELSMCYKTKLSDISHYSNCAVAARPHPHPMQISQSTHHPPTQTNSRGPAGPPTAPPLPPTPERSASRAAMDRLQQWNIIRHLSQLVCTISPTS